MPLPLEIIRNPEQDRADKKTYPRHVDPKGALESIADAFKRQSELRDGSHILQIAGAVWERMGGADGIADLYHEGIELAKKSPNTLRMWMAEVRKLAELRDVQQQNMSDLANVTTEELQQVVSESAVRLIMEDEEFCESAFLMACQNNPDLLERMLDRAEGSDAVALLNGKLRGETAKPANSGRKSLGLSDEEMLEDIRDAAVQPEPHEEG